MRPEVWVPFQKKFCVDRIIEFYGATEGNANLVNNSGVPGAIGVIPTILSFIYPICLASCDPETGDLSRDPVTGLAKMAQPGEPGHLLGLIKDSDPSRRFDGYTDKKATKEKILEDVKAKGDKWFASGDLLRRDSFGFYYWVDRIGDTYRWKGENVSTSEVSGAFTSPDDGDSDLDLIEDANVFGVEIPDQEGRAGMARLSLRQGVDYKTLNLSAIYATLAKQLPPYAQPLFLRIPKAPAPVIAGEVNDNMTGTFKQKKGGLREQGFDIGLIAKGVREGEEEDVLFFRSDKEKTFVELTRALEREIRGGKIRL